MKRFLRPLLMLAVIVAACIILNPTKAQAASVEDLTFALKGANSDRYFVSDCNESASGTLTVPATYNGLPVTGIDDYAFSGCDSLTYVTLPDSVAYLGDAAFIWCSNLTGISMPGVTCIYYNAFFGCTNLTSVTISDGAWYIGGYAFYGCSKLQNINIPDSVTFIGEYAFANCTKLQNVKLPDGLTAINRGTFKKCTDLTSVDIPKGVTSIGNFAFENCFDLSSIVIPDGVVTIGMQAFIWCSGLTSVTLPDSITTIGESSFSACYLLKHVYYTGTQEQWDAISIGDSNDKLSSATLHLVPCKTEGHSYDDTHDTICNVCGSTRAMPVVAIDKGEVSVDAAGATGVKVHVFNITGKEVADINIWNDLKSADPNFKTYTKSTFALENGTYVLRVQYTDAEGVANVISDKITVDYTPVPAVGPAIAVADNIVNITNNGMTDVKVFAFNITGKEVADINVWNQLKTADPKFKTYTKSNFMLKNGTYVLRVQYTDAEGVSHTESHEATVNVESIVPQATISGKSVTVDGKGATVTKIHAFYAEGDEIANIDSWNELKAADSSFKSYAKTQFSVKNRGAYVLRIEYVDQNGIKQTTSQLVSAQ